MHSKTAGLSLDARRRAKETRGAVKQKSGKKWDDLEERNTFGVFQLPGTLGMGDVATGESCVVTIDGGWGIGDEEKAGV